MFNQYEKQIELDLLICDIYIINSGKTKQKILFFFFFF